MYNIYLCYNSITLLICARIYAHFENLPKQKVILLQMCVTKFTMYSRLEIYFNVRQFNSNLLLCSIKKYKNNGHSKRGNSKIYKKLKKNHDLANNLYHFSKNYLLFSWDLGRYLYTQQYTQYYIIRKKVLHLTNI